MNQQFLRSLRPVVLFALVVAFITGCQDENVKPLSKKDQASLTAQDNARILMATQEALEITSGAMETKGINEGRITTGGGPDEEGCKPSINLSLNVDRTHPDSLIYSGSISVMYGDGSSCNSNAIRTGTIRDEFTLIVSTKNKFLFTSTETITFEAFGKDGIQYDGVMVATSANGKRTSVEAKGAKITYDDGTSSSWDGKLFFAYDNVTTVAGGHNRSGTISVSGALSGNTRQGNAFEASIVQDVVFKSGCFDKRRAIPVSGIIQITDDTQQSTVNYGDGTCDKSYTVTMEGDTTTYTFE